MSIIKQRFSELIGLLPQFEALSERAILNSAELITETFTKGNKVIICGNGGSAADSQHFAAEFVNSFSRDISRKGLPAMALTTDTSVITSIANDFSFDNIFARQVQAYSNPGDVLIVFTTSGKSKNCINAVLEARQCEVRSIVFTRTDSEISKISDMTVEVPSANTQHIQECHILAYHVITEIVETKLFKGAIRE
jgi:D-sedoheptulose 7-phosphate isomerase